jgi:hypothetical protein
MPNISHGYPDYGRYQAQSDVQFLHEVNVSINAQTNKSLGFVGQLPYMGVNFQGLTGAFSVLFAFYAEITYATLLGVYNFDVSSGGSFGGSIPVGGPFCQVTLYPFGPPKSYSADIWSAPAEFSTFTSSPADNLLIAEKARSVGAGANFQWDAFRTFPGQAHLNLHTTAAVWNATLWTVEYDGTLDFLAFFENAGANYNEDFYLPAAPARLLVHNGDAAAKFFDVSLQARPWSPGR